LIAVVLIEGRDAEVFERVLHEGGEDVRTARHEVRELVGADEEGGLAAVAEEQDLFVHQIHHLVEEGVLVGGHEGFTGKRGESGVRGPLRTDGADLAPGLGGVVAIVLDVVKTSQEALADPLEVLQVVMPRVAEDVEGGPAAEEDRVVADGLGGAAAALVLALLVLLAVLAEVVEGLLGEGDDAPLGQGEHLVVAFDVRGVIVVLFHPHPDARGEELLVLGVRHGPLLVDQVVVDGDVGRVADLADHEGAEEAVQDHPAALAVEAHGLDGVVQTESLDVGEVRGEDLGVQGAGRAYVEAGGSEEQLRAGLADHEVGQADHRLAGSAGELAGQTAFDVAHLTAEPAGVADVLVQDRDGVRGPPLELLAPEEGVFAGLTQAIPPTA
jgi:hypothetical protein